MEKKCQELPQSTVEKIEDLLKTVEEGKAKDLENINRNILECLLDIDNKEFRDAVKKQTRTEAQKFLLQILDDEALAKIFEDEDNDYIILKQLLNKATGKSDSNLSSQLKYNRIKDDDDKSRSILHLFGEGAESAWDWLDDYVSDECDGSTDSDCPGEDSIGAYCNVLLDFSESALEEFLDSANNFEDQYKGEVESDGYEYDVTDSTSKSGDFRVWCRVQKGESAPNPCPEDGTEPPSDEKLATITVTLGTNGRFYWNSSGYCHGAGNTNNDRTERRGTSRPEAQNIILALSDHSDDPSDRPNNPAGELYLNDDEVEYKSSNTYYLYIDDERYELTDDDKLASYIESCASRTRRVVRWRGFFEESTLDVNTDYDVYLAVENRLYNQPFCTFIKPD